MLQTLTFLLNTIAPARSEKGATATEYALIVTFIALAIIAGITAFGDDLDSFFSGLGDNLPA